MKSLLVLIAAGSYNVLMDMNLLLCLAVIAGPNIKTMPLLELQESCLYNFLFCCVILSFPIATTFISNLSFIVRMNVYCVADMC